MNNILSILSNFQDVKKTSKSQHKLQYNKNSLYDRLFVNNEICYNTSISDYSFFESLIIIMSCVDNDIKNYMKMTEFEKKCYICSLKNTLANTNLQEEILKNEITDDLINYCSEYFNWNIYLLDDKIHTFDNDFDKNIVIININNNYYPILKTENKPFFETFPTLYDYNDIQQLKQKPIGKILLSTLQGISKKYDIKITKISGKTNRIKNKTKNELYNELLNILV